MARILGIDYGTRRIGLAISDETQTLARGLPTILRKEAISKIKEICQENAVEKIVLGYPKTLAGKEGNLVPEIKKFKNTIRKATGVEIVLEDERLTTKLAEKLRKKDRDQFSAFLILQTFLDRKGVK